VGAPKRSEAHAPPSRARPAHGEERRHPRPLTEEDRRRRATEIRESMHDERAVTIAKVRDIAPRRKHG